MSYMIISQKRSLMVISLIILYGYIWPGSTLSNFEGFFPFKNGSRTDGTIVSLSLEDRGLTIPKTSLKMHPDLDKSGAAIKPKKRDLVYKKEVTIPRDLKEILSNYYKDYDIIQQEKAFKRVIRWKEDFENIVKKYQYVDWKIIAAIIKAETQGRTGRQVSSAGAVGLSQIKYQGAWAFLWDALFSKKIRKGSLYVKDYYNESIRARYYGQLQQIRRYLEEKDILVKPKGQSQKAYHKARFQSWSNLKPYLMKKYTQGEYQVAVDISAMYIDHLIFTFLNLQKQVFEIKQHIKKNDFKSLDRVKFSGAKNARWNRIREHLLTQDVLVEDPPRFRESTLKHLNDILHRLGDPNIYSAAYSFGVSKVLEHTESGKELPIGINNYVKKVITYQTIFDEIERFRLFT